MLSMGVLLLTIIQAFNPINMSNHLTTEEKATLLIEKIKGQIDAYLLNCNETNTPYICRLKNEDGGREKIHNFIVEAMFRQKITIGQALSEYERVLDPNYLND